MKYRILKKGEVINCETDQIKGGVYLEWISIKQLGVRWENMTVDHAWHKFRRPAIGNGAASHRSCMSKDIAKRNGLPEKLIMLNTPR